MEFTYHPPIEQDKSSCRSTAQAEISATNQNFENDLQLTHFIKTPLCKYN